MTDTQRNLLVSTIGVILIAAGVYWYATRTPGPGTPGTAATTTPATSTTPVAGQTGDTTDTNTQMLIDSIIGADLKAALQAGQTRKQAGDYAGAARAWEEAFSKWPQSYVLANNLGDLYMNFLKDYAKAELYFTKLVAMRPQYIDTYRNLYTMYRSFYKQNTSAARDIIELGLANNPGNSDLLVLRAELDASAQ